MPDPGTADDEQPPDFARGGLILGPHGEDSIPVFLHPGERWYTTEQVRRMTAKAEGDDGAHPA